jgi:hypothetical protein
LRSRNNHRAGFRAATLDAFALGVVWRCPRCAARRDAGRWQKRHLHRLVAVVALALMNDGDHQIVGVELKLIERLELRRDARRPAAC